MSDLLDELNDLISSEADEIEYKHELAISAFTNEMARRMGELRVSQSELARRLGVSRARVSQLMQHKASPTLRTIVEVAHALGCEVAPNLVPRGFRPIRFSIADGGKSVVGYSEKRRVGQATSYPELPSEALVA